MPRAVEWLNIYQIDMGHLANPNLSVVVARCWYLECMVQNINCMCSVRTAYSYPDLDDRIYECLLTAMSAVQAVDVRASFLFIGDLISHDQEWLGSTSTNRHSVCDPRLRNYNRL